MWSNSLKPFQISCAGPDSGISGNACSGSAGDHWLVPIDYKHRLRRRVVLLIWAGKRMFLSAPSPNVIGNWVGVTGLLLLPVRVRAGLGLPVGQDGGGRPCTAPRPSLGGVGLLILPWWYWGSRLPSSEEKGEAGTAYPFSLARALVAGYDRPRCDRSSPRTSSSSSSFSLTGRRRGCLPLPLSLLMTGATETTSTAALRAVTRDSATTISHGSDLYVKNSLYILNLLVISNRRAFIAKSFPRVIDSCR